MLAIHHSYGHLPLITTELIPFIECIFPVITSYFTNSLGHHCRKHPSGWWFGTWFIFHFILYGILLPIDFHIFQDGQNHQPGVIYCYYWYFWGFPKSYGYPQIIHFSRIFHEINPIIIDQQPTGHHLFGRSCASQINGIISSVLAATRP